MTRYIGLLTFSIFLAIGPHAAAQQTLTIAVTPLVADVFKIIPDQLRQSMNIPSETLNSRIQYHEKEIRFQEAVDDNFQGIDVLIAFRSEQSLGYLKRCDDENDPDKGRIEPWLVCEPGRPVSANFLIVSRGVNYEQLLDITNPKLLGGDHPGYEEFVGKILKKCLYDEAQIENATPILKQITNEDHNATELLLIAEMVRPIRGGRDFLQAVGGKPLLHSDLVRKVIGVGLYGEKFFPYAISNALVDTGRADDVTGCLNANDYTQIIGSSAWRDIPIELRSVTKPTKTDELELVYALRTSAEIRLYVKREKLRDLKDWFFEDFLVWAYNYRLNLYKGIEKLVGDDSTATNRTKLKDARAALQAFAAMYYLVTNKKAGIWRAADAFNNVSAVENYNKVPRNALGLIAKNDKTKKDKKRINQIMTAADNAITNFKTYLAIMKEIDVMNIDRLESRYQLAWLQWLVFNQKSTDPNAGNQTRQKALCDAVGSKLALKTDLSAVMDISADGVVTIKEAFPLLTSTPNAIIVENIYDTWLMRKLRKVDSVRGAELC